MIQFDPCRIRVLKVPISPFAQCIFASIRRANFPKLYHTAGTYSDLTMWGVHLRLMGMGIGSALGKVCGIIHHSITPLVWPATPTGMYEQGDEVATKDKSNIGWGYGMTSPTSPLLYKLAYLCHSLRTLMNPSYDSSSFANW
jgi:hypothetical protein